jgi:hypothetical protein
LAAAVSGFLAYLEYQTLYMLLINICLVNKHMLFIPSLI